MNKNDIIILWLVSLIIEKSIGNNIGIGFSCLHIRDVTALYSTDDFDTRLSKQLIQASQKFTF